MKKKKTLKYAGSRTVEFHNFSLDEERAKVIVPEADIGFVIPDRLKHFTSVQNGRLILVMGGMNSYMENPFEIEGAD